MSLAFIGLGSNIGDGRLNLRQAWQKIGEHPDISTLALSNPYLSRPQSKENWKREGLHLSERWFTNAAGVMETRLSPRELLEFLKDVETSMGRNRQKTLDRPIDLDIIYFDDLVCCTEELELPHPEIRTRMFVLAPLEELAPDHQHPLTGITTAQMKRALPLIEAEDIRRIDWLDNGEHKEADQLESA